MLGQQQYELTGIVIQIFKLLPSVIVTSPLKSSGVEEQWEHVVLVVAIVAATSGSIVLAVTGVSGINAVVVFMFVFVFV